MIQLNYRDSRPIYQQVKRSFRRLIITQALKANEKLPSVRELATELTINPNTIQRAYRELETEGYIYTVSGKGSYAVDRVEFEDLFQLNLLAEFDDVTTELLYLSYGVDKLQSRIENLARKGVN